MVISAIRSTPAQVGADTVEDHRSGACTVILQIPFEYEGRRYDRISIGPFTFGHTLDWKNRVYKSWIELMAIVCKDDRGKDLGSEALRYLRYPDADRVQARFFEMLPPEIKDSIIAIESTTDVPQYRVSPERAAENRRILDEAAAADSLGEDGEEDPQVFAPIVEDRGIDFMS